MLENNQEQKKLRVKLSTFQTTLTFNEWVEKYNVSSGYIEPTRYFQGNAGSRQMTMDTRLEIRNFSSPQETETGFITGVLNIIKSKLKKQNNG